MSIEDVVAAAREYYHGENNLVGGCLHIVLDDGNYEDGCVRFCVEFAHEQGDEDGVRLAEMLLELTEEERRVLVQERYSDYAGPALGWV